MANLKISELDAATVLADTDEVPLASSGTTKKITGANLKASVGAIVATTVAGLPDSPVNGQLGRLRIGSSPYEFIGLVYDSTLGKWVSPDVPLTQSAVDPANTGSTSYAILTNQARRYVPNLKAIYDAGLRLQLWLAGQLTNSGAAGITSIALHLYEFNNEDPTITRIGTADGAEVSVTGTTARYDATGWVDYDPGAPAEAHGLFIYVGKVTSGTGTFSAIGGRYRWAASPA